jgi:hypothetical protein
VSRIGFSRQETDISEAEMVMSMQAISERTDHICCEKFSDQVYQRESFSRACPMPFRAWF